VELIADHSNATSPTTDAVNFVRKTKLRTILSGRRYLTSDGNGGGSRPWHGAEFAHSWHGGEQFVVMRSPIDSAKGTTRTNVPSRRFPTATRAEPTTRPRIPGGGGTHHTLSLAEFPGLPSYRTDGQGQKGAGPRFLWSGGRAAYLGVSGCDGCRSVGKQVGIHGGKVGVERTATAPLTEGPAHPRVQGYGCAHLRPSSWPHGIQGKGKTLACGDLARPMRQRGRRAPLNSNQRI
jgi:hypothetical protein